MRLASFTPRPQAPALTDDERELLEAYRHVDASHRDSLLHTARVFVREHVASDVWFRIGHLHSGPKRSFWIATRGGFLEPRQPVQFNAVGDVQDFADEFLCAYLQEHGLPLVGRVIARTTRSYNNGKTWYECYLRRGRYRVEVNGLPDWMKTTWAPPALGSDVDPAG